MPDEHLKNDDDVDRILHLAIREEGLSDDTALRARLQATAAELGISPEALLRAEEKYRKEQTQGHQIAEYESYRKREYYGHLAAYILVNAFLCTIWFVTSRGSFWPFWSMAGWGLGLAFHTVYTFLVKPDDYEADFARWKEKQAIRELKADLRQEVRERIRDRHR
jgi:hypothetical protein